MQTDPQLSQFEYILFTSHGLLYIWYHLSLLTNEEYFL